MYHAQLDHETHMIVRGWQEIVSDVTNAFRQVVEMLRLSRSQTLTTFEVHRVPGSDALR